MVDIFHVVHFFSYITYSLAHAKSLYWWWVDSVQGEKNPHHTFLIKHKGKINMHIEILAPVQVFVTFMQVLELNLHLLSALHLWPMVLLLTLQ